MRTTHPLERSRVRKLLAGIVIVFLCLVSGGRLEVLWGVGFFMLFTALTVLAANRHGALAAVKMSATQLPSLFLIAELCRERLDYHGKVEYFVLHSPDYNAFVRGIRSHQIVLFSALVRDYTPAETAFILGHELGHVVAGHTRRRLLVSPIFQSNPLLRMLPLMSWLSQSQEYTADRYGLLACRDINASILALVKLAVGVDILHRIDIATMLRQFEDIRHGRTSDLLELSSTHPPTVRRIVELVRFYNSPEYAKLEDPGERVRVDKNLLPTLLKATEFRRVGDSAPTDPVVGALQNISVGQPESLSVRLVYQSGKVEGDTWRASFSPTGLAGLCMSSTQAPLWDVTQPLPIRVGSETLRYVPLR